MREGCAVSGSRFAGMAVPPNGSWPVNSLAEATVRADPSYQAQASVAGRQTSASTATSKVNAAFWENCDDLKIPKEEWVIKGLLPREGLAILAGPSTAGKSFVALDLVDKVARGEPALGGRRSYQCGIAYIAAEGANGVRKRLIGLKKDRGADWSKHMALSGMAPNLADESKYNELEKEVGRLRAKLESHEVRLGIVVIDTLSAAIPGVDENSSKDMSSVLMRLQQLAIRFKICVLLVAHVGKDTDRGVRGWSGLVANVDVVIGIQMPDENGVRIVKIVKIKDGDAGPELAFSLRQIPLAEDTDGDPVTTCVVLWRSPSDAARRKLRRPLPRVARAALTQLKRMVDDGAAELITAPGAPVGTKGVEIKALGAAIDRQASELDPEPDQEDKTEHRRWKDRRRKSVSDGFRHLEDHQLVRIEGSKIWLLGSSAGESV
jgi:AAA domain